MDTFPGQTASSSKKRQRIATREAARDAIVTLIEQAQRNIMVFGPVLDGLLFNTARTAEALGKFIARHHENRARILIEDSQQVVRDNARIIALAKRFSDAVQIRTVGEDNAGLRELFVVADERGYLHQLDLEQLEFMVAMDAGTEATMLARRFREMWDMSQPATGINTLGL